jgi:hypothetical protein
MSVWEDNFEDYERDKNDFEAWLDSINPEGDPEMDEECYNEVQDKEWEKWLDENDVTPIEQVLMSEVEYPERMIKGKEYIMTVSDN